MPTTRSSSIAVSAVISLRPWMISLMAWTGRPARRASSACEIPRASIVSASVSPGGMATFGQIRVSVSIVITHFLDPRGSLVIFQSENDAPTFLLQIDSEPTLQISTQSMEVELRNATQVGGGIGRVD